MPPAAAAAGISAAGSIAGAAIGGKNAKKVAKIQAKAQAAALDKQLAFTRDYMATNAARYQPEIQHGNAAGDLYNGAIGAGGDPNAAATAYKTFQDSTGYRTTLANNLDSVNANAYAAGLGRSGAALKGLQDRANYLGQQSFQNWLSNLNTSVNTGANAKGILAGASTNALNTQTQATQTAANNTANAAGNAVLVQGAGWSNALQNLGNLAATAFQSSYSGSPNYGNAVQSAGYSPIPVYNNPDYSKG